MGKVAIVTDSNSGITQKEAADLGISVLPMPFFINDKVYYEDIDLTQEEFYKQLSGDAKVHTSQPTPGDILDLWDELLRYNDEIIHIPMSSGLSASCETATALAADYDGRVIVVDNQRISVTQRSSVMDALALAKAGKSATEIHDILMREKFESSIYIMVDTLKYLKKGGRLTPAAAMIGTVLNLKPVLQIQGEKLDAYAKVRGQKQAKKAMLKAIQNDIDTRFKGKKYYIGIAHTANDAEAEAFADEAAKLFHVDRESIIINPLSLSVSCHIGPGALAITCTREMEY